MKLKVIEKCHFSKILPQGTLLIDYAQNPSSFADCFHFNPTQVIEKIQAIEKQKFFNRKLLVEYLYQYHLDLKAPSKTLQNILQLNDPDSLVIMTGQQPGLLTGPLYTIYKTIACLQVAKKIQQQLNRKCIPIFWMASEDHNLKEVTSVFFPNLLGTEYEKFSLRPKRGHFKKPVGLIPLEKEKIVSLLNKVKNFLSASSHFDEAEKMLYHTLNHSNTLGQWFSRLMLTLFQNSGLVLLEPNSPILKKLAAPLWEKIVSDPLALPKRINLSGKAIEQKGYIRQLPIYTNQCPFFLYEEQRREGVSWSGHSFNTIKHSYSKEDYHTIVQNFPERLSPNVYLRPILSEFLFPTLFYLGGPGEIGYFAQLKKVYEYFDLTMPILLPRLSITLHSRELKLPDVPFPQERWLNIFYFLNQFGEDFLTCLQELPIEENYFHHYRVLIDS